MKASKLFVVSGIVVSVVLLLALTVGLTLAQGSDQPQGPTGTTAVAPGAIPIQGRLTDASGTPLNGTYTMTFRLYEVETGGIALCADTNSVTVQNGLFNSYIDYCYDGDLWGQKVWFSVQVGGDPEEMTPRQVIYPVPYALGLVPGVVISASHANPFSVRTTSASGTALEGRASSATGTNYGVYGYAYSTNGYGGYFFNNTDGVGVAGISFGGTGVYAGSLGTALRANSSTGTALALEGTGRLTSTADSYIFVPGSALVREQEDNTLRWSMQANGAALLWRGATAGNQYVHIPIVLPGVLYGQSVTVKSITIYYMCSNGSNNYITATDLHKQTDADSFVVLASETTDRTSNTASSYTLTPISNNVLSSDQGILMLRLYLNFANDADFIRIGGVRVQLDHQ